MNQKREEAVRKKLQQLRLQLAGARKQMDDPSEVRALEKEIATLEAELARSKTK